jgi:catalase
MPEKEAMKMPYNPFDLTKVWYKSEYPLIKVGILELNRNPENYFQDVEQSAFNPANVVPGIGHSPDKMLQGRLFAYGDAQRYRLGVNHHQIPVNAAKVPVNSNHRDGAMRLDGNYGGRPHYFPNSFGEWEDSKELHEPPLEVYGAVANWDFDQDDNDYFSQPGKLFRLMPKDEQQRLFDNTARNMEGVPEFIKIRHIKHCLLADKAYGMGIAKAMNISMDMVK